uniref:Lid-1 n=1 Tax=Pristionchus pacificus TaxID=54126 RepID=A0A2A6C9A2_PRIPA|eukprot:PDM74633.1 lid-1 [Pristionchus pacificus]
MTQSKQTTKDKIKSLETSIFNHFDQTPTETAIKVRHCHCKIHTVSFKAKEDRGHAPIVLIHGFGTGVAYWAPNIEGLSQEYDVHCFDIPGFGRSDRPEFSSDETLAELEMVSCFEDWRREMKLDRMYIISHSFGAFFSSSYALEHPHRVIHLVLVDPWGFPEKPLLTAKQVDPQVYMHVVSRITSYFNPFFLVRCCGPYAGRLLSFLRSDIRLKYHKEGKECNENIYEYLALCNSRHPSGEKLYKNLIFTNGFAKRPMSKRFCGMDEDIRATFIYGSKTFIDPGPALEIQYQRSDTVGVHILRGAGHLMTSALKKVMRKDIAQLLSTLSKEEIKTRSEAALITVYRSGCFLNAQHIGIYVSTDGEIITDGMIALLFTLKKDVYIPNFTRGEPDMTFVRLTPEEWAEGLPSTMWNIRQHGEVDPSQLLSAPLDLLLMPGAHFGRLPYLMGLALREQFVQEVPIEDHDVSLNKVVVENTLIGQ